MSRRFWCYGLTLMTCLLVLAGCEPASDRRAVRGTVSFKAVPVNNGSIQFVSTDPANASRGGAMIKDGQFLVPAEYGLKAGKYRVEVTMPDSKPSSDGPPGAMKYPKELIPDRYNTKSTLTCDVKDSGENTFDFKLD
ncbi:hypothetical protein [Fimbriiglobus ruber]|uniref:Lipoprotein n=1 Tax=Fimbriiglobus ruber TaxID=1908690 RepID=A0A225DLI7_9BACT|nr:hypothetical protein [Fimbriiglobus ruber]OWK38346.1 hypothetical protein FRUB_07466 [Fimbriiglobus ruber]